MALSIVSNFAANVAHRNLTMSDMEASRSLTKLSSGKRVVSASDDAASMAIGSRLNAEVQSLKTATTNASQASSMLQIADGAMSTIDNVLVRMKSLSVQASSENLSSVEREFIFNEFVSLRSEIDRISEDTTFNGNKLLGGQSSFTADSASLTGATNINVGAGFSSFTFEPNAPNLTSTSTLTVSFSTIGANAFTVTSTDGTSQTITGVSAPATGNTSDLFFSTFGLTVSLNSNFDATVGITANNTFTTNEVTQDTSLNYRIGTGGTSGEDELEFTLQQTRARNLSSEMNALTSFNNSTDAENAITYVGNAIDVLQSARANVGVGQNRLEFAMQNLRSAQENNEAARSTLLDLDVAAEMTNFTSKQILVQAGVGMLSQANQMPQNLLRLLQ